MAQEKVRIIFLLIMVALIAWGVVAYATRDGILLSEYNVAGEVRIEVPSDKGINNTSFVSAAVVSFSYLALPVLNNYVWTIKKGFIFLEINGGSASVFFDGIPSLLRKLWRSV